MAIAHTKREQRKGDKMPLQRTPVLIPVEGLDYSQPSTFIADRAGFPRNIRFYRNELRKRPGLSLYGAEVMASQIMGYGLLQLSTESKYLVRASKAKLEAYNALTDAWAEIGTGLEGTDDDQFHFAVVTETGLLIITNYVNVVRKWTGAGSVAALGGSPPKARYACYVSPYLLLAYTDDGSSVKPWGVSWCDTDDPENWSTGNAGSALLSDEPSPITNIKKLNAYAAAYKRDSIWLGRKVDTANVFIFDNIRTGIGLPASKALVDVEGWHYFMGHSNFHRWNSASIEDIGDKVSDEVFERMDRELISRCWAMHVRDLNEVWFFIVTQGHSWPNEIWKYDYKVRRWHRDDCTVPLTAGITWQKTITEAWNDQTGTWDEDLRRWNDLVMTAQADQVLVGDSSGQSLKIDYNISSDNGVLYPAEFISKDFVADHLEFYKRWLQLDVWAKGPGRLFVYYSTDLGETWTLIPRNSTQNYIALDEFYQKYELYLDVQARNIRFKFVEQTAGTLYLRNFYPYYLRTAEVRS
jgi:hypothetical protein